MKVKDFVQGNFDFFSHPQEKFTRNLREVSLGVYRFDYNFFSDGEEQEKGWLNDISLYVEFDFLHQKPSLQLSFDECNYVDYEICMRVRGDVEQATSAIKNSLFRENKDFIKNIIATFPSFVEKQIILQNLNKHKRKM